MSLETTTEPEVIGNYELLSKIVEGGMGAVYKGRHLKTNQIVAVKIIPANTARNTLLLKRFEQEFRAASLIDHPNVVKAIEYCGSFATPFLVMEYVDGETIGDRVQRAGIIPEAEAIGIMAHVCEGLHRAHKQGLIHRDIKPDNILLSKCGLAKITDLGLVKDIEAEMNLTRTGKGLGTPHFMSPEQFRNAKNADVRCDVYSLGATLYMMLTGHTPFANTSPLDCWMKKTKDDLLPPRALNPEVSERVDFAVRRSMRNNSAERPASCREFMEDLLGTAWRPGQNSGNSVDTMAPPTDASTLWYMVYLDAGIPRTVKGTTDTIRKNISASSLGDLTQVLVSRTKAGPFSALRNVPEFRDLVISETSKSGASKIPASQSIVETPRSINVGVTPMARGTPKLSDILHAPEPVAAKSKAPDPDATREAVRTDVVHVEPRKSLGGVTDRFGLGDILTAVPPKQFDMQESMPIDLIAAKPKIKPQSIPQPKPQAQVQPQPEAETQSKPRMKGQLVIPAWLAWLAIILGSMLLATTIVSFFN